MSAITPTLTTPIVRPVSARRTWGRRLLIALVFG